MIMYNTHRKLLRQYFLTGAINPRIVDQSVCHGGVHLTSVKAIA